MWLWQLRSWTCHRLAVAHIAEYLLQEEPYPAGVERKFLFKSASQIWNGVFWVIPVNWGLNQICGFLSLHLMVQVYKFGFLAMLQEPGEKQGHCPAGWPAISAMDPATSANLNTYFEEGMKLATGAKQLINATNTTLCQSYSLGTEQVLYSSWDIFRETGLVFTSISTTSAYSRSYF